MAHDHLTRRAALLGTTFLVLGCGKQKKESLVCGDTSGLSPAEIELRGTLAYNDLSPEPAKQCTNCLQFEPPRGSGCGGCKVLKGPIHPNGYCRSWVTKPA